MGLRVGEAVGDAVGLKVGLRVGEAVGDAVGLTVVGLTMGAATSARRASPLRNIATSCRGCVEPTAAGCRRCGGNGFRKLQAPVLP